MSGEIRRESFADEASWLEFQANQLALAKHKRQRQATQQYAAQERDYDTIKRINQRIRGREAARRYRERFPDRAKEQQRESYWRDPERSRAQSRGHYRRNPEHYREYARWYRLRNPEIVKAVNRRANEKRRRNPAFVEAEAQRQFLWRQRNGQRQPYIPMATRSVRARQFEHTVVQLRQEGLAWEAIAETTGSTVMSCRSTFQNVMRRDNARYYEDRAEQRTARDFFIVGLREKGCTFAQIGNALGITRHAARLAYIRSLERLTRPDNAQRTQQQEQTS